LFNARADVFQLTNAACKLCILTPKFEINIILKVTKRKQKQTNVIKLNKN